MKTQTVVFAGSMNEQFLLSYFICGREECKNRLKTDDELIVCNFEILCRPIYEDFQTKQIKKTNIIRLVQNSKIVQKNSTVNIYRVGNMVRIEELFQAAPLINDHF